jgi:microcystin-dependent protein
MEPLMAEIKMFAGNYAPQGWFFCDGSLLPINQYSALFALLGTTYGGDGVQTFQLPDLRGRTPIHSGNGQGRNVSRYELGQIGGTENVTISAQQMPAHNHLIKASTTGGDQAVPGDGTTANYYLAATADSQTGATTNTYTDVAPDTQLNSGSVTPAGGSQPVSLLTPYLGINYIIAWTGIWPSRP